MHKKVIVHQINCLKKLVSKLSVLKCLSQQEKKHIQNFILMYFFGFEEAVRFERKGELQRHMCLNSPENSVSSTVH